MHRVSVARVRSKRPKLVWAAVFLLAACGAAVALALYGGTRPALPEGVSPAAYARAAAEFERHYGIKPKRLDVLSWLGDAAARENDLETALSCYEQIPSTHPTYGCTARDQQARVLLALNRAGKAEEQLNEFLRLAQKTPAISPARQADARERLRYIYEVELRLEERQRLLKANIAAGFFDKFDLMKYCFPGLLRWNGSQAVAWLEGLYAETPQDFRIRVALGRYRTGQGRLDEAREILEQCCRERPQDLSAQAALLACLREAGNMQRVYELVDRLPPPSESDPWLLLQIRGHVLNERGKHHEAAECFERMLHSDPASAEACLGLAQACAGLGETARQQELLRKAQILARIQNRLGRAQETDDTEVFLEIAQLCEQIDLDAYALIWASYVEGLSPGHADAAQLRTRLQKKLSRRQSTLSSAP